MSWVRSLYYTPLIDTDVRAYEQFIAAVQSHFCDGSTIKFSQEQYGSADRQQHNCCLDNTGCGVDCPASCLVVAPPDASVGVVGRGFVSSSQHGFVCGCVEGEHKCCCRAGGLPVDSVDCPDGGAHSDICVDAVSGSRGSKDSKNGDGTLGPEVNNFGRWHWSNAKKRERRKAKKLPSAKKKLLMEKSWRSGVVSDSGLSNEVVEKGFFKDCDESVRKDLRDSRAKMLIAQNNLKAKKAERDLEAANSVQGIVQQMVDITTSVAKLQKCTADEAVHGWAKTVASTMAKSITECSSSVPTLDSVGFGVSGLKSTDGEVLDPVRVAAFERDMKYVEDSFASMDSYSEADYKYAVYRVKCDFPDVAYTKTQREVAASKAVAVQRLLALGVDYQKIQEAIYPDEEHFS